MWRPKYYIWYTCVSILDFFWWFSFISVYRTGPNYLTDRELSTNYKPCLIDIQHQLCGDVSSVENFVFWSLLLAYPYSSVSAFSSELKCPFLSPVVLLVAPAFSSHICSINYVKHINWCKNLVTLRKPPAASLEAVPSFEYLIRTSPHN